jgi:hypothetical protein
MVLGLERRLEERRGVRRNAEERISYPRSRFITAMLIKLHCSVILSTVQLPADCNRGILRMSNFHADLIQMTTDTVCKREKNRSRLDKTA